MCPFVPTSGGGGASGVTSFNTRTGVVTLAGADLTALMTLLAAANPSMVVGGTTLAPTVKTGTLDVIAAQGAPVAAVALNAQKITGLANGSGAQDAAAFGQIPAALPPNGSAGGDLGGTYPSPTVAKVNGVTVSSVISKIYINKPADGIAVSSTSVGAFSTAWQNTGVVVAAGQNVRLRVVAAYLRSVVQDFNLTFKRGTTSVAAASYNVGNQVSVVVLEWVDENPGAATHTYEVQGAAFATGSLTIKQTIPTTDTSGGSSIFTAEVYTP